MPAIHGPYIYTVREPSPPPSASCLVRCQAEAVFFFPLFFPSLPSPLPPPPAGQPQRCQLPLPADRRTQLPLLRSRRAGRRAERQLLAVVLISRPVESARGLCAVVQCAGDCACDWRCSSSTAAQHALAPLILLCVCYNTLHPQLLPSSTPLRTTTRAPLAPSELRTTRRLAPASF